MSAPSSWRDMWGDVGQDAERYPGSGRRGSVATLKAIALHQGVRVSTGYRLARHLELRGLHVGAALIRRVVSRRSATDINYRAELGPGLRLPHPVGVVIGDAVVLGRNCTIMQSVTLGGNQGRQRGERTMPLIGDDVFIGPGAVVVGPCVIGSGARVPANAVVTTDLEP